MRLRDPQRLIRRVLNPERPTVPDLTEAEMLARFARKDSAPGNVKGYGATGDGITDDTAAILAAVAAEPVVYFPPGVYLHSQPIVPRYYQTIRGAGKISAQLKNTGDGPSIRLDDSKEYVVISHLGIVGTSTATTAHGIELAGASTAAVTVDHVRIHGVGGHGIYGGHAGHVNNIRVMSTDCLSCGLDGISLEYATGQVNAAWITHCNLTGNDRNGITFYGNSVTIDSNTIQANGIHGVSLGTEDTTHGKACVGSTVSNNYFEQNGRDLTTNASPVGLYVGYQVGTTGNRIARALTISGNYFAEAGAKYRSLIHVKDLKTTDPTSKASAFRTRSNGGSTRLLTWEGKCPLGFGVALEEDLAAVMTPGMVAELPPWVLVSGAYIYN